MVYVCLLCTALMAASYDIKEKDSLYKKLLIFCRYLFFIFLFFVLFLFLMNKEVNFSNLTADYYLSYMLFMFAVSYLLPRFFGYYKKNFKISVTRVKK